MNMHRWTLNDFDLLHDLLIKHIMLFNPEITTSSHTTNYAIEFHLKDKKTILDLTSDYFFIYVVFDTKYSKIISVVVATHFESIPYRHGEDTIETLCNVYLGILNAGGCQVVDEKNSIMKTPF